MRSAGRLGWVRASADAVGSGTPTCFRPKGVLTTRGINDALLPAAALHPRPLTGAERIAVRYRGEPQVGEGGILVRDITEDLV